MSGSPPFEELEPPRTLVLADDPLVREGFASLLSAAGIEVVDDEQSAEIALVDGGASRERAELCLAALATIEVPFVALVPDESVVQVALSLGASGVVLRAPDGARLYAALAAVHHGLHVIDAPFAPAAMRLERDAEIEEPLDELTAREREVLALLSDGLSNKRIAKRLEISEHTAKFHIGSILDKLGVRTRTEAAVVAARRGLLML